MKSKRKPEPILIRHTPHALTPRETQVLMSYAQGHSYQEIGDEFGISGKTVGSYIQRIRDKLRAKSRADLMAKATELAGPKSKR